MSRLARLDRYGEIAPRPARGPVDIGLWLPVTPLVLLLAPLVLIAAPLLMCHRAARRVASPRAAWALGAILLSLSGTAVAIDTPRARIRIRII